MVEQTSYSSSDYMKSNKKPGQQSQQNQNENQDQDKDNMLEKGKKMAEEGAENLMDKAKDGADSVAKYMEEYTNTAVKCIKENPFTSILAAAVGGLVIGWLIKE